MPKRLVGSIGCYSSAKFLRGVFKKNLNASKPSEHPPQVEECLKGLGGNIGSRDKTSSWYQKGSPR